MKVMDRKRSSHQLGSKGDGGHLPDVFCYPVFGLPEPENERLQANDSSYREVG